MIEKNVIWVNEDNEILGEVSRTKADKEGLLHRVSVIYLNDNKGNILIQERVNGKLDHSSAGHVDVGESYIEAAKRELKEELGVSDIDLLEIGECSSNELGGKTRHKFKVYKCTANPVKLEKSEVKNVFWADPEEIWQDMKNDEDDKKYCGGFKVTLKLYLKI